MAVLPFKYSSLILLILSLSISGCAQTTKKSSPADGDYNHLKNAGSPYLQEHADNPVNWHEWGSEALELAQKENKPLIISIGYSACHWCHVMERESFMDTTVAQYMNAHFVCIKVDREERPDIDQIYMNAAQLISGSGGWPLNAFALPDGRPFYAGTYFPTAQWMDLLKQITNAYTNKYSDLVAQAEQLTQGIKGSDMVQAVADSTFTFSKKDYNDLFAGWQQRIDFKSGGFEGAPKFPLPAGWEFLLQFHYLTGNEKALTAVTTTLNQIAMGGINDQIGGGFARYSTDANWFAPHFEKMLYDNGQLVSLYANAFKVTKNQEYASVIRSTLTFVNRELTSREGGFYSSLNAESEGEEGKYYVWTKPEIDRILPDSVAPLVEEYYHVTKSGNWENQTNILYRDETGNQFAEAHNIQPEKWEAMLAAANQELLTARSKRIAPSTDDKILTGWNALMLKGYVDAYLALGDAGYLKIALKNANFLESKMVRKDGRLWRNYKDGKPSIDAFLDDYVLLADAYISLYQATLDVHWLQTADKITEYAVTHFKSDGALFYYTSDEAADLIARKMEISDNVIPASNSVMAQVLYNLGLYYDRPEYKTMSKQMLEAVRKNLAGGGPYYANWAMLLGKITYEPYEVAVMGNEALPEALLLQSHFLPNALFMGGDTENLPLLEDKLQKSYTIIYVCKDKVCKMPVDNVDAALKQMK